MSIRRSSQLQLVQEKGWRRGLNNLLRGEYSAWFKSSKWWKHLLLWFSIINVMMIFMIIASAEAVKEGEDGPPVLFMYGLFGGMFVAFGVMIIMQRVLVGEKRSGTAAWVLSKPVTRTAFVVSRLVVNSIAILFTSDRSAPETAAQLQQPLQMAERHWLAEEDEAQLGQLQAFRCMVAFWQGDFGAAFAAARAALELLPADDVEWRGTSVLNLGLEHLFAGRMHEARAALRDNSGRQGLVTRRKGERAWVEAHPGPAAYGKDPGPPPSFRSLPAEARLAMEALLWGVDRIMAPEQSQRIQPPGDSLRGTPASAGRYTGPVRIIMDESQFRKLQAGDVLLVEASRMQGSSTLTLTGQLGDVMKESARAALSWFRAHAAAYGADPDFSKNAEIHLHVPSGAIPKDGPSAGVTIVTALASELTRRPVRGDIAMTGEVTLSGRVLPVGGIKEKVLAARRVGIREVILPRQNEKNVKEDLSDDLKRELTIHYVQTIDEVLLLALLPAAKTRADRKASRRDQPSLQ